ncbi:MAG: SxtJ family membrane protein [Pseudomonadota bacterium]
MSPVSHTRPPEPSPRELRHFAWITGAMFALLFSLVPWLWSGATYTWSLWLALVLGLWGLLAPATLGPLYRAWMRFAHILGAINNRILLGLFFFVLLMPIGLLMRLLRPDAMRRRFDRQTPSYRVASSSRPKDHLEGPF